MRSKLLFIGDVGLDYYPSDLKYRPGGCALNSFVAACSGKLSNYIQLAIPKFSDSVYETKLVEGLKANYNVLEFDAEGELPVQHITLNDDGERFFGAYDPGYLNWPISAGAAQEILAHESIIAFPLYKETQKFFQNLIPLIRGRSSVICVDFSTLSDFGYSLSIVESIAKNLLVAQISISGKNAEAIKSEICSLSRLFNNIHFVLTSGEEPGVLIKAGLLKTINPIQGIEAVDSTGAGDAFFGAYVSQIVAGREISQSLDVAVSVSANVVRHLGGCDLNFGKEIP